MSILRDTPEQMTAVDSDITALRSEVSRTSLALSDYSELLTMLQLPSSSLRTEGSTYLYTSPIPSSTSVDQSPKPQTGLTEELVMQRAAMTTEQVKAQLENSRSGKRRNNANWQDTSSDDVDISSTYELSLDGLGLTNLGTEVGMSSSTIGKSLSSVKVSPSAHISSPLVLFTSLRKLTFNFNQITSSALTPQIIRAIFSSLSELKDLQLDYNKVEKGDAFLMGLSGTNAAQKLESLSMVQNSIKTVSPLTKVSFPKLTSLDLSHNKLTIFSGANFKVPNLTTLDLSFNSLTSLEPSFVGSLVHLTFLNVSGNQLTSLQGIESLTVLEELHASRNNLCYVPTLAHSNSLRTVGQKTMQKGGDITSNGLSMTGYTGGLQVIDVSNNNISSLGFFPNTGSMAHVWSLNISNNNFTMNSGEMSPDIPFLEQLAALFPKVEMLDIGNNGFGTIVPSYQDLRHLAKLSDISELNLVGTLGGVDSGVNDEIFHGIPGMRLGMTMKEKHRKVVEAFLPSISVLDKEMIKAPQHPSSVGINGICHGIMEDSFMGDSTVSSRPGSAAGTISMRPQSALGCTSNKLVGSYNGSAPISYRPTSSKGVVRDGAGSCEKLNAIRAMKAATDLEETRVSLEAMIQKANKSRLKCLALCGHMQKTMQWALFENGIGSAPTEPSINDIEKEHIRRIESPGSASARISTSTVKCIDRSIPLQSAVTSAPGAESSSEDEGQHKKPAPTPPPSPFAAHMRMSQARDVRSGTPQSATSQKGHTARTQEARGLAPLDTSKGAAHRLLNRNAPSSAGAAMGAASIRGPVGLLSRSAGALAKRSGSQPLNGIPQGHSRAKNAKEQGDPNDFKEAMIMAEEKLRREQLGVINKNSIFSKYNSKGQRQGNEKNKTRREMATSTNTPEMDEILRRGQEELKLLSDSLASSQQHFGVMEEDKVRVSVAVETSQGKTPTPHINDTSNATVIQSIHDVPINISSCIDQYRMLETMDDDDNDNLLINEDAYITTERKKDAVKFTNPADPRMERLQNTVTSSVITMEDTLSKVIDEMESIRDIVLQSGRYQDGSSCTRPSSGGISQYKESRVGGILGGYNSRNNSREQEAAETVKEGKSECVDTTHISLGSSNMDNSAAVGVSQLTTVVVPSEMVSTSLTSNKGNTEENDSTSLTNHLPEEATYFDTKISPSKKIVKTLAGRSLNTRLRKK